MCEGKREKGEDDHRSIHYIRYIRIPRVLLQDHLKHEVTCVSKCKKDFTQMALHSNINSVYTV